MAEEQNERQVCYGNFSCKEADQLLPDSNISDCKRHENSESYNGKLCDSNTGHFTKVTYGSNNSSLNDGIVSSLSQCSTEEFSGTCTFNNKICTCMNCTSSECFETENLFEGYSYSTCQPKQPNVQHLSVRKSGDEHKSRKYKNLKSPSTTDLYTVSRVFTATKNKQTRHNAERHETCPSNDLHTATNSNTLSRTRNEFQADVAAIGGNDRDKYLKTPMKLGNERDLSNSSTHDISNHSVKRRRLLPVNQTYKCEFCDQTFCHLNTLKRHCAALSCDKPYKCDICKRTIYQICHVRMHTEKETYDSDNNVKAYTGLEAYISDLCQKKFMTSRQLKRHKSKHVSTVKADTRKKKYEKQFECDICDKRLNSEAWFKRHKTTHEGNRGHFCSICNKECQSPSALKLHIRVHTGEKPFQCDVCKKRVVSATNLKKHKDTHLTCLIDKPFKNFWDKNFNFDKEFKCDECEIQFHSPFDLKMHKRNHTDKRTFKCDKCGNIYQTDFRLKIHLKLCCN